MKSIGLSEGVYEQLLLIKHEMEREERRVISYDEVVFKLIHRTNRGGKNNEDNRKVL